MIDLDKLEELSNAATPGPWFDIQGSLAFANDDETGGAQIGCGPNAEFIAYVRKVTPALIAELRAARQLISTVRNSYDAINGETWIRKALAAYDGLPTTDKPAFWPVP